jgi:hypothetical protein
VGGSSSSNNISPLDLINIRRVAWGQKEVPSCSCKTATVTHYDENLVELLTAKILEKLQ